MRPEIHEHEQQRRKYLVGIVAKNEERYQEFIYVKLFEILDTQNFTNNSNGIFINLNKISDETIEECIKFIETINDVSISYLESETNRDNSIKLLKSTVNTSPALSPQTKPKRKKSKARQVVPYKEPKLTGVFKRISQCMGREGYVKKLEVFEDSENSDDSDDSCGDESDCESSFEDSNTINDKKVGLEDDEVDLDEELDEETLKELGLDDNDDDDNSSVVVIESSHVRELLGKD